ncbi:Oidioi.mRNA.OKI2018_I69.chr1.g947.t1.cds [Oikopleura dioica]|uniref:Oidioi.mRNA.OKI2018_I69.chr1.g947.t1.cds n=1 Tax=Oikopleura dioica TaxID=34765 RepID=A0ABN7SLG3_OIKDI|nr:Oidioi.mRNA.OKI2018_I69.chr1.g947.t1.cds [Oikopleura dioica]
MGRSYSRSRSRSGSRSSRGRSASKDRSRSVLGHIDGYDPAFRGYRVKVADLNTRISKYELEKEFDRYGKIIDLILIRRQPTICFIVYKYSQDARYAARKLNNLSIWSTRLRAELAKPSGKARKRVYDYAILRLALTRAILLQSQ